MRRRPAKRGAACRRRNSVGARLGASDDASRRMQMARDLARLRARLRLVAERSAGRGIPSAKAAPKSVPPRDRDCRRSRSSRVRPQARAGRRRRTPPCGQWRGRRGNCRRARRRRSGDSARRARTIEPVSPPCHRAAGRRGARRRPGRAFLEMQVGDNKQALGLPKQGAGMIGRQRRAGDAQAGRCGGGKRRAHQPCISSISSSAASARSARLLRLPIDGLAADFQHDWGKGGEKRLSAL